MNPLELTQSAQDRLVGRDILCFSHDWTGDPLSKTHLMRLLAKDNRILWVNSIGYRAPNLGSTRDLSRIFDKLSQVTVPVREVEPNLFVFTPFVVPGLRWGWARRLNMRLLRWQVRRAMRRLRFADVVNWVFNPAAGELAGNLGESAIIYYCVDEYTAFSGVDTTILTAIEMDLLGKADLVLVSSQKLLASKRSPRAETALIRHGVDYDHFRSALDPATAVPEDIAHLPRPVIGYFGLIAEDWVDLPLLCHVARSFPTGSLVMLGKSTMDTSELMAEPNVHFLGRKPYASLPAYCRGFDVAVIPFPVSEVTLNANPLKAREYLAAGLPVISTAIPEVQVLGQCGIARTPDEFVERIREALRTPGPDRCRSETMATESWSARLEEIRSIFERTHLKPHPSSKSDLPVDDA